MESTNTPQDFHLEQQQQEQVASSSFYASAAHGSLYGATRYSNSEFAWSPNSNSSVNNVGNRNYQNLNPQLYRTSRSYTGEKDSDEEIRIPWGNNTEDDHQHPTLIPIHEQSSNKSKLGLFNSIMFPKFTDMMSSTHSSIEDHLRQPSPTSYLKIDKFQDAKLLMKPALLTDPSGQLQFQAAHEFFSNEQDYSGYGAAFLPLMPSRGTYSQIFPSINISNLSKTHLNPNVSSSPLETNVQALDLLTSARFGGIHHEQSQSHALGQQHLQQSAQRPHSSPNKPPSSNFYGESTGNSKRSQTEPPKMTKTLSKKSRTESRASPPFKVRKEKLGDRIATLQQLVAPFGKTDTASVLMEAIGYIKFLQNQVETLSVPYMKSSRTRTVKPTQMVDRMANADGSLELGRDLRSRGLCLVPLSCMSYVTNDDGGCWPL